MKKRNNLRNYITKVMTDNNPAHLSRQKFVDNFQYCEYNAEISSKFYKFLDLACKLSSEIQFHTNSIVVTINLMNYKKKDETQTQSTQSSGFTGSIFGFEEDFITFNITKTNFKISRNHADICGYKDTNIYSLYKDKLKVVYEEKSGKLFNDTINDVLDIIPSIGREYKIDEIFND